MSNPLILTLDLQADTQAYFNELRRLYFPAERNFLDAHLTLFHQLPATEKQILQDVETMVKQQKYFSLKVSGIVSTGNGVAFKIESEELQALHKRFQQQWQQWIIPQDRQKLWPHITIQNKVAAEKANELIRYLSAEFNVFETTAKGLSLWEYLGGPWKFLQTFNFQK